MTETIDELTKHMSLTEEGQDTIVVQEFLTKSVEEKAWLCLIGKLLTPRAFSTDAMKFTLMAIWKPIKVMLSMATFWVQIHNLPLISMTREVGKLIGNKVGLLVDVEYGSDGAAVGCYLRIRVQIDISKPLRRGVKLSVHNRDSIGSRLTDRERVNTFNERNSFARRLHVTIDCKDTNGELKTRGVGKLDDEEKFRVSLPSNILEKYGSLKEECFAHLHSASTAPCPAHSGNNESSYVVFKSKIARKHTFSPAGILKFSPVVEDIPSKPKHSSQLN
ncbi:unnamed protein product [Camellia sinensis]